MLAAAVEEQLAGRRTTGTWRRSSQVQLSAVRTEAHDVQCVCVGMRSGTQAALWAQRHIAGMATGSPHYPADPEAFAERSKASMLWMHAA